MNRRSSPLPPMESTLAGTSGNLAGRFSATESSAALTAPGGSSGAKVSVAFALKYGATVRLRLTNESPASAALGTIWVPFSVSRCTARQFTSTTRPLPNLVSSQSPIRKGCSNSSSSPEMTGPTAFCTARPITMEVTPTAVIKPPMLAPHTHDSSRPMPMMMRINRPRSTKMPGRRLRQLPGRASPNRAALAPDSTSSMMRKPTAVAASLVQVPRPSPLSAWLS